MAKRQRSLRDHYFAKLRETDVVEILSSGSDMSSPETADSRVNYAPPSDAEIARGQWKEQWVVLFDWLLFDSTTGRVFCKVCRDKGGRSAYAKDGAKNLKVSSFQHHARSGEHRRLAWATQNGEKVMEKAILQGQRACDEAVASLFRAAYFLGKQSLPYSKFPGLCKLLVTVKAPMTLSMYHDEKACADLIFCISSVIQKRVLNRVRNSAFYGIMVDESTDISVTGHLVVFATIVEEGLPVTMFLGLLEIAEGKKDAAVIFDTLISSIRKWGLDLHKFVGFGSDGASTMVGSSTGVAARIKEQVNPYLLACHCVAHRTNLAALDAAKSSDCKAVTTLCESLESVLVFFCDLTGKDADAGTRILQNLGQFKFIYILYFLADILHCLAMLSKVFQSKFVDVTTVGSIVRSEIAHIRMLFIVETADLNADTFNESTGYHVLPEYGSFGGLLRKLPSEIRGNMYHEFQTERSRLGTDLEEAL